MGFMFPLEWVLIRHIFSNIFCWISKAVTLGYLLYSFILIFISTFPIGILSSSFDVTNSISCIFVFFHSPLILLHFAYCISFLLFVCFKDPAFGFIDLLYFIIYFLFHSLHSYFYCLFPSYFCGFIPKLMSKTINDF